MTRTIKKEDQDFIIRFLNVYKGLTDENQNLVLAFVQGMELQRALSRSEQGQDAERAEPDSA